MKHSILTILALAALFLPLAFAGLRRRNLVSAANTYDASVETHEKSVTRTNDAAIATRHLLYKKGAADGTIAVCGATDVPLGTVDNLETGMDARQSVLLLGRGPTKKVVAAKAIAVGVKVYTAASGKVTDTAVDNCAYIGVSLTSAAADGDVIEINDTAPVHTDV